MSNALNTVRPTEAEAAHVLAAEGDVLPRLLQAVRARTMGDGPDVESAAGLMACSLLAGDASRNVDRAASRAVRSARAVVAEALRTELPTEDVVLADVLTDDTRSRLWARITAPAADARYAVTLTDVLRAVALCLMGTDHGALWRDVVRAYLSHSREACQHCRTAGRLPGLSGMLQHTRGIGKDRAEYWALRRQVEAAGREAGPRVAALLTEWQARPGRGRNLWTADLQAWADAYGNGGRVMGLRPLEAALRTYALQVTPEAVTEALTVTSGPAPITARADVPEARREALRARQAARREAEALAYREALQAATEAYAGPEWAARLQAPEGLCKPDKGPDVDVPTSGLQVVAYTLPTSREVTRTRTLHKVTGAEARALPDPSALDTVTVRTPDGETYSRPMTEAEAEALQARPARPLHYAGEEYGTSTAPAVPDPLTGQVKSGKRAGRPRKGTRGSTGPMVGAGTDRRAARH